MEYCKQVMDFINEHDTFAKSNNMQLTGLTPGHARAELLIDGDSMNAIGTVQGGAIFTLADLAFAGAANSFEGLRATSMSSSISFLRPGSGSKLYAVAEVVNKGKRSCLVEIEISSEDGKKVAKIMTTGFFINS